MPPFRKHLTAITPYASAREEFKGVARIYLDANENPYGVAWAGAAARYPDPYHQALRQKLAAYLGVSPEEVLCGAGSDEIIDWLIRVTCEPGFDTVLALEPSYGVYQTYAQIHGVNVERVLLNPDYSLNLEATLRTFTPTTRVAFLCSPNNPTGNRFAPEAIATFLEAFSGWVVLDEAYVDFAEIPNYWLDRRSRYSNLIVLRTFSKAWGMAGWRVGYAIAPQSVVTLFYQTKLPYNLSQPAQEQALAVLSRGAEVQAKIGLLKAERERLAKALITCPWVEAVFPSEANFVLAKVRRAKAVYEALLARGIVTRYRGTLPLCAETIRFTVGLPEENEALLSALCDTSLLTETVPL